jgi:hypothetical protein
LITINLLNNYKQCTKCNKHLPKSLFWKDKYKKNGYVSRCSLCIKEQRKTPEYKSYRKTYEQTEQFKNYHKNYEASRRVRTEKDKESRRKRDLKYRKEDPLYKLKQNTTRRIRYALKVLNQNKKNRTIEYLGCSIDELKIHLENQFKPGMSWENYGEWEIDHIIPCASANNEPELLVLFHYTNLQPLWATENRQKSDKYERPN